MNVPKEMRLAYFVFGLIIGECFLHVFAPLTDSLFTYKIFGDHRAVHFFIGVGILVYYFLTMLFAETNLLERPDFFFLGGNAIAYITDEFIYALLQVRDIDVYTSSTTLVWAFFACVLVVAAAVYFSKQKTRHIKK
jgi:hypothetical protein